MNIIVKQILNNPIKKTTFYALTIFDVIVLILCLLINNNLFNALMIFLIISLITDGTVWLIVGSIKKCPYCGEVFAMTKVNSQFMNATQSTMRVQNRVRDRYGRIIATVDDHIPAVKREYLNTYRCTYCGRTKQNTSYVKTRD